MNSNSHPKFHCTVIMHTCSIHFSFQPISISHHQHKLNNTQIHVAFLNHFLRRHVTNSKTSEKDMYFAPSSLKLLQVLTVSFSHPVLPPPNNLAFFVRHVITTHTFPTAHKHTHTYLLFCRWLGTKLLAERPQLFVLRRATSHQQRLRLIAVSRDPECDNLGRQ